ncbi:MAG: hypothetical protein IJF44_02465 [Clostridia bacterium]|nr:hypothetical protein [Clostridia bacterium]
MSEQLNQFEDLKERLSRYSITALIPSILYYFKYCYVENKIFKDNESLKFFQLIQGCAIKLREVENQSEMRTGIPHFALHICGMLLACRQETDGNQEGANETMKSSMEFLDESLNRNFGYAYNYIGKGFFLGNSHWKKDEKLGLEYLKKATELPISEYIGLDHQGIKKDFIADYENCLAAYEKEKQNTQLQETEIKDSVDSKKAVFPVRVKEKLFSKGHYIAVLACFLLYTLLSVLIRNEFGLESSYALSVSYHPVLGAFITLLLNYGVVLWLLMTYFYRRNNGKQNWFFVIGYIVILLACLADGILPYIDVIESGMLFESSVWINVLIYPIVFLISHRLLSLLVYAILKRKEGDSDYRIYLGFVLFAPFTAGVLLIGAIGYLFLSGQTSGNSRVSAQSRDSLRAYLDLKEYVGKQIKEKGDLTKFAVYYNDTGYASGWKGLDYWDNDYDMNIISGEWGYVSFQAPNGKIYRVRAASPDKTTIYFFNEV